MPDSVTRVPVMDRAIKIGPAESGGSAGVPVGDSPTLRFTGTRTILGADYGTGDLGEALATQSGGVDDDSRSLTIPYIYGIARGWGSADR